MPKQKRTVAPATAANLGYEAELWRMADALRGSMDAAEYKHVVLGLIFLKYISDAFEEQHAKLEAERAQGADPEDPDEYRALSIFWGARSARLRSTSTPSRRSGDRSRRTPRSATTNERRSSSRSSRLTSQSLIPTNRSRW